MTRKLIAALIANLFVAPAVFAEATKWEGNIGAGGLYNDNNARDEAYLNEYQDLSNGAAGYFGLTGRGPTYWLDGYGENIGRDDMYVDFLGGRYNTFSYRLYSNWMPHNYGWGPDGARTPYNFPGGATQPATFPSFSTTVPPWNSFDYQIERRDTGGSFEWKSLSPWYVRADVSQVDVNGTKWYSPSQGTSPGNGFVELAGPAQYTTNNLTLEGGYSSSAFVGSVSVLWSNFDNDNNTFSWTNGYFAPNPTPPNYGTQFDTMTLPPDNDYFKVSANGSLRNLWGRSTASARYTYATSKSSADMLTSMLSSGGVYFPTNPSSTVFNGQDTINTFSLTWSGNPTAEIDFKAYYNYYDRENESDSITFNTSTASGLGCTDFSVPSLSKPVVPCSQEFYSVEKNNFGLEGYYRLNPKNRLGAGYQYLKQDFEGVPYSSNTDNSFFVDWRTTMWADSTFWLKYTYATRSADYLLSNAGVSPADPFYLERFVSMYAWTDRKLNQLKAQFDTSLSDGLGLSLEYTYNDYDYDETTLGRTSQIENQFYVALNFGSTAGFRGSVFGAYESTEQEGYHRYINSGACNASTGPNCFDPNSPPFANAYNWSNNNEDKYWMLGVSGAAPVGPVALSGSVMYSRNRGSADLSAQLGQPEPINDYDSYSLLSISLRADWRINRSWSLAGGYSYQKYTYSDDQYNNYQYLAPPASVSALNPSTSYLSGIFAYPEYTANILWILGRYYFGF